jgi:four helix bundle protein
VPLTIRNDVLWKMESYRLGLFLSDLAWVDSLKLLRERRSAAIADQSVRPAGNISSNIAEGYSWGKGRDRARFYEYGLGSARETRDWYFKARHVLREKVSSHRIELATRERRANRRLSRRTVDESVT